MFIGQSVLGWQITMCLLGDEHQGSIIRGDSYVSHSNRIDSS